MDQFFLIGFSSDLLGLVDFHIKLYFYVFRLYTTDVSVPLPQPPNIDLDGGAGFLEQVLYYL